jgi:uncharacterized ferritin-like protein (DUF455 family)
LQLINCHNEGYAGLVQHILVGGMNCLRNTAHSLLLLEDAAEKAAQTQCAQHVHLSADVARNHAMTQDAPGRPTRPQLVAPKHLPRRSLHTIAGRAALVHALAHIEFNAINLALDAVSRFAGLPEQFYRDWFAVAQDEARHFMLLCAHLAQQGYVYGDFDAHDGLWEMAHKTRHDVLARMALVPRVLEARGLDASPAIAAKLRQAGDEAAAKIVDVILHDEVRHVAIGNKWFYWLCAQRGLQPGQAFEQLALQHRAPALRGPFNIPARRHAGFTELELARLQEHHS